MDHKKLKKNQTHIQDFSQNTGNNSSKDSRILLNIFPKEIWQIILSKYCRNSELEIIGHASLFFRDLLCEKRVTFLFPRVWKVLGAQYLKKYTTDAAYNEAPLNKKHMRLCDNNFCRCPGVPKWYSGILKLRMICKTWCIAVNNFLHALEETTAASHYNNPLHKPLCKPIYNLISTSVDCVTDEFTEYFMSSNYTFDETITLFSKILHLRLGFNYPDGNKKQYLKKFGKYFTKCFFTIFDEFGTRVALYGAFREIVELLPNLTLLEIEYVESMFVPGNAPRYVPETSFALLNREIALNPLRNLENLQTFSTTRLLSPFVHGVVRVAPNISNLRIRTMSVKKADSEIAFDQLKLEKLDAFYINIDSSARIQNLEETTFTWPLTKLEVCFDDCIGMGVFISWPRVFNLLENKWGNLQTLTS